MQIENRIYCDYQATTPVDPRVIEKMINSIRTSFGNPHSSDHIWGWESAKIVENAKLTISEFLKVNPEEVFFTSGATESDNLAILGIRQQLPQSRNHIAVTSIEHAAVLETAFALRDYENWSVDLIEVDSNGLVKDSSFESALKKGASLFSVMAVNNEIGTIQPIRKLADLAHNCGAYFHCDAAQAIGSGADLTEIVEYCDSISFSGHKFYAPKGIGLLILKETWQENFHPIMFGGHQQNSIRPGTVPTQQVVSIAEAIKLSLEDSEEEISKLRILRDYFYQQAIANNWPVSINGPALKNRHVGNINLCFGGIDNQELLGMLQPKVAASTGSACNSGSIAPSHVLSAIGLNQQQANSSIRFSFGRFTTKEQIDQVVLTVTEALANLI